MTSFFKAQRDGIDRPEICRDILAGHAVAPGGAAHKHAVLIFECNGKAVYLRLDNELRLRELLPDPRDESFDLTEAERILEALERHGVSDRLKHPLGAAADALSGRIWRDKLRVLLLNRGKLTLEHIIFAVLYLGVVLDIIFVAVIV